MNLLGCGGRASAKLIVVHDDIDLPLGKIKVSQSRDSTGHKGIESVIKELGTKDFTRVRIGVSNKTKPDVLKKFSKENQKILNQAKKNSLTVLAKLLK